MAGIVIGLIRGLLAEHGARQDIQQQHAEGHQQRPAPGEAGRTLNERCLVLRYQPDLARLGLQSGPEHLEEGVTHKELWSVTMS